MLYSVINTTSFLSHPSSSAPQIFEIAGFSGSSSRQAVFHFARLGALWTVRIVHLSRSIIHDCVVTVYGTLPAAQVELPKYAGRPGECTSFFFTVIVCQPYLEQRPVELRRGLPGPDAERFSSAYATADNGFPWKLVARTVPAIALLYLDTMPREMRTKRSHSLAPFHGIIVDAYSTVTLSALTVDETSSNQPRLPLMVRYNSYEYCTCINHCSLAWPRLLCCNRRSSWPHDMIYN